MTNKSLASVPLTPASQPAHTPRRDFKAYLPWITTPALCVLLVAVWWFYIDVSKISAFILPTPVSVWHAWIGLLVSKRAWIDTAMTVYATLLGFLWAMIVGVGLGVLIARVRWLEQTLNPFIVASQVLPKVALVPLFVVWFGFGVTSKVLIAATLAFFPILTNTVLGVKSIDQGYGDVMTSLNATRWQVFRRLEFPSSLPYIITGMEVGIVLALIGAIVGEYVGGDIGLGHLLVARMNAFETDGLFAVMIHMTILGFLFYFAISLLRHALIPWHRVRAPRHARRLKSGDGSGLTKAGDHRSAQQMHLLPLAVGGDRLQVGQDFAALCRILFSHAGAVRIRLSDDLLQRHRPAAPLVEIEPLRQRRADAYVAQRSRQFECVVQAAIEAHAARWAIEMRGIAGERNATAVVVWRDALVHAVGPLFHDVVARRVWDDLLQARLDRLVGDLRLDRLILARIDGHPPAARNAQQRKVAASLPAIGDVGQPLEVVLERKRRRREQRCLRICLALEAKAKRLAHHRTRAVGADHETGTEFLRRFVAAEIQRDAAIILRNTGDFGREKDLRTGLLAQRIEREPGQLPLLALHAIRVTRRFRDHAEIEHGTVTLRMQPHLPLRRDQALRDERSSKSDIVKQIERRRVKGRRAQIGLDVRCLLQQRGSDALTRQQQRHDKTDWPAADDGHFKIVIWLQA